jgi:hypothetical protein
MYSFLNLYFLFQIFSFKNVWNTVDQQVQKTGI